MESDDEPHVTIVAPHLCPTGAGGSEWVAYDRNHKLPKPHRGKRSRRVGATDGADATKSRARVSWVFCRTHLDLAAVVVVAASLTVPFPAKFAPLHFRLFSRDFVQRTVEGRRAEGSCAECVLVPPPPPPYLNEERRAGRGGKEGARAGESRSPARARRSRRGVVKYSGEGRRGDERSRALLPPLLFTFGLLDRFTFWRQLCCRLQAPRVPEIVSKVQRSISANMN